MSDVLHSAEDWKVLLQRARGGDESSFWRLSEDVRFKLKSIVATKLSGQLSRKIDASDVVQDAFAAAVDGFAEFRGDSVEEWEAWLRRIAENKLRKNHRWWHRDRRDARRERPTFLQDHAAVEVGDHGRSPSSRAIRSEMACALRSAIDRLPGDEGIAVRMRHLEGESLETIAAALGRTNAATAGLLKRAMKRLREVFHHSPFEQE